MPTPHIPEAVMMKVFLSLIAIALAMPVLYVGWFVLPNDKPNTPQTACAWASYNLDHANGTTPDEMRMLIFQHSIACETLGDEIDQVTQNSGR